MGYIKVHHKKKSLAAIALAFAMATAGFGFLNTDTAAAGNGAALADNDLASPQNIRPAATVLHPSKQQTTNYAAGQLTSPWAIKAGGKTVAYVRSAYEGRQVINGLRIHYYDNVEMQQEADIEPLITVEKVKGKVPSGIQVKSVKEAVDSIVKQNEGNDPVIEVSYSNTLKETRPIEPKTKVIKMAELEKGQKRVESKGVSGSKYLESEITQVNSRVVDKNVMNSKVIKEAKTEIIYEGTALSSENKGKAIVAYAKKFLGNKYVWGGESLEHGVDCSGYTMKLYEHYGISIPHSSSAQGSVGKEVKDHDDLQPGDLLIYPGHVAMYAGDGMIIHAAGESEGIIISPEADYADRIKHIRRIFGTDADTSTDSMFPDVAVIEKAYQSDKGFGDEDGYAEDYSGANTEDGQED